MTPSVWEIWDQLFTFENICPKQVLSSLFLVYIQEFIVLDKSQLKTIFVLYYRKLHFFYRRLIREYICECTWTHRIMIRKFCTLVPGDEKHRWWVHYLHWGRILVMLSSQCSTQNKRKIVWPITFVIWLSPVHPFLLPSNFLPSRPIF